MGNRPPSFQFGEEDSEGNELPPENTRRLGHSRHKLKLLRKYLPDFVVSDQSNDYDLYVIRNHWDQLCELEQSTLLFDTFYTFLFDLVPEVKPLFHSPMQFQGRALMNIVGGIKSTLQSKNAVERATRLAVRHMAYGVRCEHFNPLGLALMSTLKALVPSLWTDEVELSWRTVYSHTSVLVLAKLHNELNPDNRWTSTRSAGSIGRRSTYDTVRFSETDVPEAQGMPSTSASPSKMPGVAPIAMNGCPAGCEHPASPFVASPAAQPTDEEPAAVPTEVLENSEPESPRTNSALPSSTTKAAFLPAEAAGEPSTPPPLAQAPAKDNSREANPVATQEQQHEQPQQQPHPDQQGQPQASVGATDQSPTAQNGPNSETHKPHTHKCNITNGLLMEVFALREEIELVRDEKEAVEQDLKTKLELMQMTIQKLLDDNDKLRKENVELHHRTHLQHPPLTETLPPCAHHGDSSPQDQQLTVPSLSLGGQIASSSSTSASSPTLKLLRTFGQLSTEPPIVPQRRRSQVCECPIPDNTRKLSANAAGVTAAAFKKSQSNRLLESSTTSAAPTGVHSSDQSLTARSPIRTPPRSPRSIRSLRKSSCVAPVGADEGEVHS